LWLTIEALLRSSPKISYGVKDGAFEIHGASLHSESGRVQFLGEHPSKNQLLMERPPDEVCRTADDPPVPAEEALVTLFSGNARYASGFGGQTQVRDQEVLFKLSEGGQNPIAVVIGCADSRAPIEILFDMRPGDLFILRNAGNTCTSGENTIIGSAEYAIANLRSKLVVVTGHTKCGAVTAAIDLARQGKSADQSTSIGKVLRNIMDSAVEAVRRLPEGSVSEQVKLATRLNVFATMQKVMTHSSIIKAGVVSMDLQVHGAVYDLFTGKIEWLGEHPEQEKIVGAQMPFHKWKVQPYSSGSNSPDGRGVASEALERLREGNKLFLQGKFPPPHTQTEFDEPFAIIVGGSEVRIPIEQVFSVQPGALVVQRTLGGIDRFKTGTGDTFTGSIEFAVLRYQPKLLVVLGESSSFTVDAALEQLSGAPAPTVAQQRILTDQMVSVLRAVRQVEGENVLTAAGKTRKIKKLAVELSALYTIEQLLASPVIRNAVQSHAMEMHIAMLNKRTGRVEFLGEHPILDAVLQQHNME